MDSTNPFHFQQNAYPFHNNYCNQFHDSIDNNIFGQSLLDNVLHDDYSDNMALPFNNNTNEFFTEVGFYQDVKIDDDFFINCDIDSFYQVSPIIDEKPVTNSVENVASTASNVIIRGRKRSVPLQLDEIRKHFDLPITKAAKEMRVGLTVLKKRCRELNIMRWPHRKIKSLEALINNVKEMGLEEEMVILEKHKKLIQKLPDLELTDRARKLRQACFKANYKKRLLANIDSSLC